MKRSLVLLAGALIASAALAACDGPGTLTPEPSDPALVASSDGLHLRDLDTQLAVGPDTTLAIGDTLRVGLAAGNGKGPQNNKNVVWTTSDPAVVSVSADRGTARLVANAAGTATVTAQLGGNARSVVITVAGPTNTPPVANPDAFEAIGNVTIPVPAPGVLANDTDAEGGLQAVPGTLPTAGGGSVTLAADGSFTYLSAAGFTGADQFSYQATDGTATSAPATVTLSVAERVWYVENDAAAPGDGRDVSPFATLAQAEAASSAGETIFVRTGDGTAAGQDAGIELKAGQALIGQGIADDETATVNGVEIVLLTAGAAPSVANSGAPAVALATGNTVRGFLLTSSNAPAIEGSGFGSFTASELSAASTGSAVIELSVGALDAEFVSLASFGGANGIVLAGTTGSFAVTGAGMGGSGGTIQDAAGDAVSLQDVEDVSLAYMIIAGAGGHGVAGMGVDGFALLDSEVTGAGDGAGESALFFATPGEANLTGEVTIARSVLDESASRGMHVHNVSGSLALTITDTRFEDTASGAEGEDGLLLVADGTATITALIDGGSRFENLESDGVGLLAQGAGGAINVTIRDSEFIGAATGDNAISARGLGSGALRLHVESVSITGQPNAAIVVQGDDAATLEARILASTIGGAAAGSGSVGGRGIEIAADDDAVMIVTVENNVIQHTDTEGIHALVSDALAPALALTLVGNTVGTPDDDSDFPLGVNSVLLRSATSGAMCADVRANEVAQGSEDPFGPGFFFDAIQLTRQNSSVFAVERLVGTTASQAAAHVQAENPATPSVAASGTYIPAADGTCAQPGAVPQP